MPSSADAAGISMTERGSAGALAQKRLGAGAERALRFGIEQLVRRNLRGVWVRGELPIGPAVWATNHHSWWDFFVATAALRAAGRTDVGVLMAADNIGGREFFGRVGVVGTDRLRSALDMVRAGSVLIVFPEGDLRPAGALGPLQPGAGWLAERTGAQLLVVATRVVLRGHQAAEAYLDLGAVDGDAENLAGVLSHRLSQLDRELADADPTRPLPGFSRLVPGVRSWQERFAVLRGRR